MGCYPCRVDFIIVIFVNNYVVANFIHPMHTDTENVIPPQRFNFLNGRSADHTAISNNTDILNAELIFQSPGYRNQCLYIGGIARHYFGTNRIAVIVDNNTDDNLIEIGTFILGQVTEEDGSGNYRRFHY